MTRTLTAIPLVLFGLACTLSTGAGNLGAGLLLATAVLVVVAQRGRGVHWPPRQVLLALGAVLVTHAVACLLASPGPQRWDKFTEELWLELLLVSVPVVAAGRPEVVRRAVELTLLAGVITAAYAVYQWLTGRDLVRDRMLFSTGGEYVATAFHSHHLSFGGQIMLALVVAMAWLRRDLLDQPRRLWLSVPVCVLLGLGLIWSFARSAQLGTLVAAVALVPTLPGRWRRAGVAAVVAVLVLAAVMPSVRNRVIEGFTDENEVTRPNLWRSSVAGIAHKPVLGWGQGNFRVMLAEHEVPGIYESRAHSHNDYLMHAVNAGLLGLVAWLWLLWATVRHLHAGWRRAGSGSWIVLGALLCQVSMAVAGIFQVYQTDDEPEMLLYFLVGCGLALLSRSELDGTRPDSLRS